MNKIPQVAIALDYENVSKISNLKPWITYAESLGNIVFQKAYHKCWENSKAASVLEKLKFELVEVFLNVKNMVDCICMFDCLKLANSKSSPDIFVLFTGDKDFAQFILFLKSKDKYVIVVARSGSHSKKLAQLADKFYCIDEKIPQLNSTNEKKMRANNEVFLSLGKSPQNVWQEWVIANKISRNNPVYSLVKETGPSHAKEFTINVRVDGKIYGTGKGKCKKEANKQAAIDALRKQGVI